MLHTMNRRIIPLVMAAAAMSVGYDACVGAAESEFVSEEAVDVPAWSMQVIQRHHGPRESDAILIDVFLVEKGKRRLLAKNIVGPIVLFEDRRRILSCESQGSGIVGQGPVVLDLTGRKIQIKKHPGYLRDCVRIERSNLLLLHYNLVADGTPYNLARVVNTEGKVVLEKKLAEEGDLSVSDEGKTYRIRIPAPDLPG